MALNTVVLKWDLTDLIQAGLSATLSITPTAQLSDTTDHVLIPPVARAVNFTGGTGQLAGIVANDNASILPAGTGYLISVTAASGQVIVPQFQTQILFSNGATQWLDALAVVPVVTTSYQYLPLPPGGAPAAGKIWVSDGGGYTGHWADPDTAEGTVTSVNEVAPVSGNVTLVAADVGAASTGALTSEATTRANADTTLSTAIGNEVSRAEGAESTLGTAISAETTRAETAEGLLEVNAGSGLAKSGNTLSIENSGVLTVAHGGTGAATQQAALDALAGAVTSGLVLRGNGTHVSLAALQAGDVPTLNQNTTGTAGGLSSALAVGSGGTGQVTAAAAYNALSPMTAKGDMEYDSAAGTAARLPVGSAGQVLGVAAGVPAWQAGLTLQAATTLAGYTLVNGTGTIISWTTPNDGALHRVMVFASLHVSSTETGGIISLQYTLPDGTLSATHTLLSGNAVTGDGFPAGAFMVVVEGNTPVTVKQLNALTGGAAVMWAEIWGS